MRQLSLFPPETELENGRVCGPLPIGAPIIVSNGVGVDSVALLIELRRRDIRPDAIVTALVGRDGYGNEHGRFPALSPGERGLTGACRSSMTDGRQSM